jgi:hypothetical protein
MLSDKRKLRFYGNRVLMSIFGPQGIDVTGGQITYQWLSNLEYLYYLPNVTSIVKLKTINGRAGTTHVDEKY